MTPIVPTKYTYKFTDLLTNVPLGQLPLTNVTAQAALSSPGQFTADVNMADERFRGKVTLSDIVIPQRTAYWIDRDGRLIAGGIVWDDDYDSATRVYSMTGATFDSYADYQMINDLLVLTNIDLDTMTIRLWNDLQSRPSANIGMIIPAEGSVLSGTIDSEEYDPGQQTMYGSAIQSLSQQQPGFDYYVSVGYDSNNNPQKTLVLGDPFVGVAPSQSGLVFRRPGNVLDYKWPTLGSQSPNDIFGIGGGVGNSVQSEYTNQARLDAGYPLVQGTAPYKNIFDQAKLDSTVRAWGNAVSNGFTTPTLTLSPNRTDTPVGSFVPGDPCRVIIQPDERFPLGLDTYMRITTISVNPSDTGQNETVTVTLGLPVSE